MKKRLIKRSEGKNSERERSKREREREREKGKRKQNNRMGEFIHSGTPH